MPATPVDDPQLSLSSFLTEALHGGSYIPFGTADGTPIVYDHENPDNPFNSVSRHMRFVIVAMPDSVGSNDADGNSKNQRTFLQCVSWVPHVLGRSMGLMRFHQCNSQPEEWTYFGDSFNEVSLTYITTYHVVLSEASGDVN